MVPSSEPEPAEACMIVEDGQTYCIDPLESTLQVIGKRWALLVIGVLGNHGAIRFSDAKRTIPGISARALSAALTDLQGHGLATRHVDPAASPPAVSYALTDKGRGLRRALIPLIRWAGGDVPPAPVP